MWLVRLPQDPLESLDLFLLVQNAFHCQCFVLDEHKKKSLVPIYRVYFTVHNSEIEIESSQFITKLTLYIQITTIVVMNIGRVIVVMATFKRSVF